MRVMALLCERRGWTALYLFNYFPIVSAVVLLLPIRLVCLGNGLETSGTIENSTGLPGSPVLLPLLVLLPDEAKKKENAAASRWAVERVSELTHRAAARTRNKESHPSDWISEPKTHDWSELFDSDWSWYGDFYILFTICASLAWCFPDKHSSLGAGRPLFFSIKSSGIYWMMMIH